MNSPSRLKKRKKQQKRKTKRRPSKTEGFLYTIMKRFCYLLALLLIMVSCATDSNQEQEKLEIRETLIAMWQAIEEGDIERYSSYVHPDFTQFGEYDSVRRSGKEAEVAAIKDWIERSSPISTSMKSPKITINGNMAFISYYWSDHGITDGKPFATKGKSTRIFVKEKGKWLCIHGHYTLLP